MNRLTIIPLILLLSACALAQSTPVISPTGTLVTPNIAPSKTPTRNPTETPAPTKDPNAPEAYTKFENGKYYLDKNGETFMWTEIETSPTNHFFEWTRPAIVDENGKLDPKGIKIKDNRIYGSTNPSATTMFVYLLDNSEQPGTFLYVNHPAPKNGEFDSKESQLSSFSARYVNDLFRSLGLPWSQFPGFVGKFYGHSLGITITTPDGVTHPWDPAGDYIVTQVPFDKATGIEFNEYHDEKDHDLVYRVALTTDENGNLKVFIAVSDFTKLNDDRKRARFTLAGLYEAITYANQTIPSYKNAPHFEPPVENGTNRAISESGYSHLVFEEK